MAALELRPYQEEAVELIVDRLGVLLALVMGAGKTVVTIEAVRRLREEEPMLQTAVFATNSLKYQWKKEISQWDPQATVVVIDGDKKTRQRQYRSIGSADYTILTYDLLIHDWDEIRRYLPIDAIVADEVTNIKGFKAKRSKRLKALAGHAPVRIGLSGQPVENRPEELFSIMEFVDPLVLGGFQRFDRTFITRNSFGKPIRYKNLDVLHKSLEGVMFRKSREDIAEFLPERSEISMPVKMDEASAGLYSHIVGDLLDVLAEAAAQGHSKFDLASHYGYSDNPEENRLKGLIMSRITCMRLLASHPKLLLKSADDFDDEEVTTGSEYASSLKKVGLLDSLSDSSSKLSTLDDVVDSLMSEGEETKVVVFSGFKPMVSIIEEHMRDKGLGVVSITGDVPAKDRQRAIDEFNESSSCRVFVSSDAGAYGVNLHAGTHLINYDLPWSSGALAQRVARIDRTSSKHSHIEIVYMYLIDTIEEYQYGLLQEKSKVASAFVDGDGYSSRGVLELELGSLGEFLRRSL